ncbi:ABC transporter ATP-binding protein [Nocardiopsis sp. CNT312]|uniref:ABC transporter transmembrane domain-containing protein n=1 Tax=Nocardiopsis sp. CNT312 TaxID=1137268 RepID=UPI00048DE6C4|nr:ABC transporter ATP-binding protein [Nocardiopsis sp. CNT312]
MRDLPEPPGVPDHRSADRYLLWLARRQWASLTWGSLVSGAYTTCGVLSAAALGAAIDSGLADGDSDDLLLWCGVLTGLTLIRVVIVPFHERTTSFNWYASAYRTVQSVTGRAVALGPTLTRRLPSGEVVAVGTDDIDQIGEFFEDSVRGPGAVVSIAVAAALMLAAHTVFGLAVLAAVPLITVGMVPLLRSLSRRQTHQRDHQAELTTIAGDLVAGLRVLRGVGGERAFVRRYRDESRRVRDAGVRVGWTDACLQAARTLLPGLLLVGVVWYGARLALEGALTLGLLVAFYGYTRALGEDVRRLMLVASLYVSARVAAGRITGVLGLAHDHPDPAHPRPEPEGPCDLRDPVSGVTVTAGEVTGVVCAGPSDATAVAARLGRYREDCAELVERSTGRTVSLRDLPLKRVRERVLVAANDAHLFSGRLRDELDPGGDLSDAHLARIVRAAHAGDVVERSPLGWDTVLAERGREHSGGEQQRLRLARALAVAPEVLVLVEPASAVDVHTEGIIAQRLAGQRLGRTTALITTSPLLLAHTDRVCLVRDGRVVAEGTHRTLLASNPDYAATVAGSAAVEEGR